MFENRIISEQDLILGRLRMADDWVAGQAAVADHQLLENNQVDTFSFLAPCPDTIQTSTYSWRITRLPPFFYSAHNPLCHKSRSESILLYQCNAHATV